MSAPASEFARPLRLDTLGEGERTIELAADPAERAALARRFGLIAIDALTASARVRRAAGIVHVEGEFAARVTQSCIATGDPLPVAVNEPFRLRFAPEGSDEAHDEMELSAEDCDTIPYEGGAIDLGEAVAETLALALDPFPRGPQADAALRAAGVAKEGEEEPSGPFAGLATLRGKLHK